MSEPASAELVKKGIEAARTGNRLLARLHFERAIKSNPVDPIVWLWMAWLAESPLQATLHLKKLQTTPYAATAALGLQWLTGLGESWKTPVSQPATECSNIAELPVAPGDQSEANSGPVYALGCPGCSGRLRIWGKLIGPLHRCPACGTVFVAEQDPDDPTHLTRRRLSSETRDSSATETSATTDGDLPLVLVVDDRATRRQLMLNVLRRSGYRVLSAVNGDEARTLVTENTPNLILVDGNLHTADAFQICKLLRSCLETQTTPIIILSNKTGFFDQVQAKLAGCTVYVTKPCEANTLLMHVEKLTRDPSRETLESSVESCICDAEMTATDLDEERLRERDGYAVNSLLEFKNSAAVAVSSVPAKDTRKLQESIFG